MVHLLRIGATDRTGSWQGRYTALSRHLCYHYDHYWVHLYAYY